MKVYSPNDVSTILQIKPATLRKYSSLLEKYGYKIERNTQNHRYYQDKDIITLRNIVSGSNSGDTLEETIKNVVQLEMDSSMTNDTNSVEPSNRSEIDELKQMIQQQTEILYKQNEVIESLTLRLDEQQTYIKQINHERDNKLMQAINEIQEAKEQLAITDQNQEQKEGEEKPGFWSRIFGRNK